jgi:dTDP-4-dehydrorhamnose 3,5-epimerase
MIKGVVITPLNVIDTLGGNVMHAMKKTSAGYAGFGEAYFSQIEKGAIKAWKRHKKMTLNLVVPVGKIKFILFDDRKESDIQFQKIIISKSSFYRLTVPPMVWMGFQDLSNGGSMVLNIASIEHDPLEVDRLEVDKINYNWRLD